LPRRAGGAWLLRGGKRTAHDDCAQYDENCFLHRPSGFLIFNFQFLIVS
jgi:hypothetical protein